MANKITWNDILNVADEIGVEPCAIQAVYEIESAGSGFLPSGKPKILFEGHVFWKELKKRNIDPNKFIKGNEDILYSKWTKKWYKGGEAEYKRLERAKAINRDAALMSASYGAFQIMGFNYGYCGVKTIDEFIKLMEESEVGQLKLLIGFLKHNNLIIHLKNKNWAAFAKGYNGAGYATNRYDVKLRQSYDKCKISKK